MIRKFYDAGATEGIAPHFELGESISLEDVFEAQKIESEAPPITKEEIKDEVKVEVPQVEAKAEVPIVAETTTPQIDWKTEAVKNKKELLPLLGIDEDTLNLSNEFAKDDFVKKLVTYRKENGNLTPFIEAATKDWDKVSHDQLVMDELKRQYSSLSPDKAEKLARSEFNQRFNFKQDDLLSDEENAEMAELVSIKLESEGEKIRNTRKQEQKNFLDSVKPIDRNAEVQKLLSERETAEQKEFEAFKNHVETSPAMAKLFADKKIIIGSNGNSFNYAVNPDTIKELTLNTNKFYSQFWDGEKFNQDKWNRAAAYSIDPIAYDEALINHGRSLGTKDIVEKDLINADDKTKTQRVEAKTKSLAKAFMQEGESITLDQIM